MKTILLFQLALISFTSISENRDFKRLEELYESDKISCYKLAKYNIEKNTKDYSHYFFAIKCKLYLDSAEDIRFTQNEIRIERHVQDILEMISYAKKVNNYMNEDLMYLHNWFFIWDELNTRIISLVSNISHQDMNRANRIADIAKSIINIDIKGEGHIAYSQDRRIANLYSNQKSKKFLNGIPNGDEDLASSSIDKEIEFLRILNKERIKKGMQPLKMNQDLTRAARYHSFDMGSQNYFAHQTYDRPNNGSKLIEICGPFDRIRKFSKYYGGENLYAGGSSAQSAYNSWYESPGHYRNMFNPKYKEIGIGFIKVEGSKYTNYWTTNFK
tara:strand:+ start:106 stop:1092 length:987 start_codon:yes stop_codon:yes gene_type:complete